MTAGLFHASGLYQGQALHGPSPENPKGYFEDASINQINNRILSRYVPAPEVIDGQLYRADAPGGSNGWLSRLPLNTVPEATVEEKNAISEHLNRGPFCLKDTRFCYLLDIWRDLAPGNLRFICVFRRPEVAALSVLRSLRMREGLFDVAMSVNQALDLWTLMYTHVLERHATSGGWLFVHYEDITNGKALPAIREFSGCPIDETFPDKTLNRTAPEFPPSDAAQAVFERLLEKAV